MFQRPQALCIWRWWRQGEAVSSLWGSSHWRAFIIIRVQCWISSPYLLVWLSVVLDCGKLFFETFYDVTWILASYCSMGHCHVIWLALIDVCAVRSSWTYWCYFLLLVYEVSVWCVGEYILLLLPFSTIEYNQNRYVYLLFLLQLLCAVTTWCGQFANYVITDSVTL